LHVRKTKKTTNGKIAKNSKPNKNKNEPKKKAGTLARPAFFFGLCFGTASAKAGDRHDLFVPRESLPRIG
jgi:hypothetical protein